MVTSYAIRLLRDDCDDSKPCKAERRSAGAMRFRVESEEVLKEAFSSGSHMQHVCTAPRPRFGHLYDCLWRALGPFSVFRGRISAFQLREV